MTQYKKITTSQVDFSVPPYKKAKIGSWWGWVFLLSTICASLKKYFALQPSSTTIHLGCSSCASGSPPFPASSAASPLPKGQNMHVFIAATSIDSPSPSPHTPYCTRAI